MSRSIRRSAAGAAALAGLVGALVLGLASPASPEDGAVPAPGTESIDPPFTVPILEHPLVVTGTFGDMRSNHFHAGLDIETNKQVGWPVHVPADGQVVRVRASGVGYGRSIYIQTDDDRLLVFGHLDAVAEPVASYVAARQDTTGMYEQDLWPDPGQFRVHAGDVIAWTGQSGSGGPHLHVEVRHGDMAIHPLRAGYSVPDTVAPRILRVTVVPLDDASSVAGAAKPKTIEMTGAETPVVSAWGRLRLIVEALDADGTGDFSLVPWRVRVTTSSGWIECRFDSVSWATDMPQSDFVYDRGRYTAQGSRSLVLASPVSRRPRVIQTPVSLTKEAGVIVLDESHPADEVTIEAADLAGHVTSRKLGLRGERPTVAPKVPPVSTANRVESGSKDPAYADTLRLRELAKLAIPGGALWEPTRMFIERTKPGPKPGDLELIGTPVIVGPVATPLLIPVEVSVALPPKGAVSRIGLYRDAGDGWEWVTDSVDPAGTSLIGAVRRLGRFALFRDATAPRIKLMVPPRSAVPGAYSRWALEAKLDDPGSGVDPIASRFEVDGRHVPTEWDPEANTLRWRPLRAPAKGTHRVFVQAVDHAGNQRQSQGSFVIE